VHLACERHLRDLRRSKTKEFFFRFDAARAEKVCRFIELMPHTKNKWAAARLKITLEGWQCFVVCSIYGWISKKSGRRRFREATVIVPRKNGKSPLAAAIGDYMFLADGEFGAEVYSGASTEKQAWEVFRPARQMVLQTPDMAKRFGITVGAKQMAVIGDSSRFEPVIGKPGDGAAPSCALIDEYHEHPDATLYDTMKTGMVGRENPILLVITTAGTDRSGPCYALQKDLEKVLEGTVENENWFGIIYTIDEGEDWTKLESLIKANPNWGVSVDPEILTADHREAIRNPRKENSFKTKHLNIWVNADERWITQAAWDACCDPKLKLGDFEKQECFIGLDLASKVDLASKIIVFRRDLEGLSEKDGQTIVATRHYYVFGSHYLNESKVQEAHGTHYAAWSNAGQLIETPGNETDYVWITDDLVADADRFVVLEVPHDPYHAAPLMQFAQAREDWNRNVVPVVIDQNVRNMSAAMKELEAAIASVRIHHDGDPVLAWAMSNVVCRRDRKGNIFPTKERQENKIDPVTALLMAVLRASVTAAPKGTPRISVL
jgi:phage terminase large subunit-like protein